MVEAISEAYPVALTKAATKAFDGLYDNQQLGGLVNRAKLEKRTLDLILAEENAKGVR